MDGEVVWDRIEAWRSYQRCRVLSATLGDIYVSLARAFVETSVPTKRRASLRRAAGLLVRAVYQFQLAGMSRQAQVAWRYARFMHRAAWRAT